MVERAITTEARAAGDRRKVDPAGETNAADVEHIGQALEAHDRVRPLRLQRLRALEQTFVAIDVERRQRRRAGERMAGVGVAVEELDRMFRPLHEGVIDVLARDHAPIGTVPEVTPLAKVTMSDDAIALGGEQQTPEP